MIKLNLSFIVKVLLIASILVVINLNVEYVNSHEHGHAHDHHGHAHNHHGHNHGHNHGHGHGHEEPPSFKYSRAANEQPSKQNNQHQSHHGHSHEDHAHSHKQSEQAKPNTKKEIPVQSTKMNIALHAILSTLLISIAPFFILFFIPLNNNSFENQSLLKVLLAFASGSLLGDAFLHLIPHALSPHDHTDNEHHTHSHESEHSHDHSAQTKVGLWILAGIMAFLLVEKLVRNLNGESHTHSHGTPVVSSKQSEETKKEEVETKPKRKDANKTVSENKKESTEETKDEKEKNCASKPKKDEIQIAGYLNLAADFAHNFTDGLAIGASYLAGQNIGLITTLTILFHEVPHEIGDFAILIQSGCTKKKAIFLQLVTALGALSGTLLSLIFESAISGFATSCILPFTAGGFIYIATVSIIPEIKESSGFFQSLKEIVALSAGVFMMVIIAMIE